MNLSGLIQEIKKDPLFSEITRRIIESKKYSDRLTVTEEARAYLIAALFDQLDLPVLVVTSQPESALRLYNELQAWCSNTKYIYYYPDREQFSGDGVLIDPEVTIQRLQVLDALITTGGHVGSSAALVICSAVAAASKTLNKDKYKNAYHQLKVGMQISSTQLITQWQTIGYEFNELVEVPGFFNKKGGIIDIFSPCSKQPVRIEFFGNKIESLRYYDPKTQRSLKTIDSIAISPAFEFNQDGNEHTILDYLPERCLVITDLLEDLESAINDHLIQTNPEKNNSNNNIDSSTGYGLLSWDKVKRKIADIQRHLILTIWNISNYDTEIKQFSFTSLPKYGGRLNSFLKDIQQLVLNKKQIVVISQQIERLAEVMEKEDIGINKSEDVKQLPEYGVVMLVHGSLGEGWKLHDSLNLFTDSELFGIVKLQRQIKRNAVRHHLYIPQIKEGDYVVHIGHGVGKYIGLIKVKTEKYEREYLLLEYAAGDRLYVPSDQTDRVTRYIGSSDQQPRLSRLGTQEWSQTKERIKKSVQDIAEDLLKLYAKRETISGFAYSPDSIWQKELESSFPFIETVDQLAAVKAVKADMEMGKPMDRLICGDVGYGKTEVALRAAFKAVMDNKQVALLVPTTILAQQHLTTFKERLQAFPVRIAALSRFSSEKEKGGIIEALALGNIDICIGTHRLLQKDVRFKDLGLLIIDEEQRFGVVHKEYFKKMRDCVEVLTLSATPIPRTLHMSLSGIKDLSVMETPPEERLPIKTFVGAYNDSLVRRAILFEIMRHGQVFYVHNRVQDLVLVAERLMKNVPEAKILIAHGQVQEEQLENIMTDFYNHKADVLLTTTIIESGLDIPNVNTLIIDNCDQLGLTQLYQLRGRIGRSNTSSFSYFLFNGNKQLTYQAKERLRTIAEATELGAGFAIAMRDFEIRGAGNLLGTQQSGYIAAVGFDLYCRLLAEAVDNVKKEMKGEAKITADKEVEQVVALDLPLKAYISDDYISSATERIGYYQRLAHADYEVLQNIAEELNDRFGKISQTVLNLLYVAKIKSLALSANVESIVTKDKQIIINCRNQISSSKLKLEKQNNTGITIGNRQIKLNTMYLRNKWQELLEIILKQLQL